MRNFVSVREFQSWIPWGQFLAAKLLCRRKERAMQHRRRFKQSISLKDRLALFAKEASEKASKLPPGPERESLLKKARQAETATRVDEWATDCGQPAPLETSSVSERGGRP
ncbi:hypothetical protein [Bradyrhizobium ottawaense]|uniref:hypothetical protein n=1 Tax=Bradyrhizobium ottawaense TaxID=931866 RepID=UPI003FA155A7